MKILLDMGSWKDVRPGTPLRGLQKNADRLVASIDFELIASNQGNRIWQADCGCTMTSGSGAYGTAGSAKQIERCHRHAYDEAGNLIQD